MHSNIYFRDATVFPPEKRYAMILKKVKIKMEKIAIFRIKDFIFGATI